MVFVVQRILAGLFVSLGTVPQSSVAGAFLRPSPNQTHGLLPVRSLPQGWISLSSSWKGNPEAWEPSFVACLRLSVVVALVSPGLVQSGQDHGWPASHASMRLVNSMSICQYQMCQQKFHLLMTITLQPYRQKLSRRSCSRR